MTIDWTQAPNWAQWHALDADGDSWWHEVKPTPLSGGEWDSSGQLDEGVYQAYDMRGIDWRNTLTGRPLETKVTE
jgi:hypothetical protein